MDFEIIIRLKLQSTHLKITVFEYIRLAKISRRVMRKPCYRKRRKHFNQPNITEDHERITLIFKL